MNREEKRIAVERLQEFFGQSPHAFLLDFRGLKVAETTELRRKVQAESDSYRVVKNRLALRATAGTDLKVLGEYLKGPTAVIAGSGDVIVISRILRDFAKDHPALTLKGAWVEGQAMSGERVLQLANLPGRDELIGRFVGLLSAPLTRLCLVFQSPLRGLVTVLKEIGKQKS